MEILMSPQKKSIIISEKDTLTLKEQVLFQNGQEGKRIWESGITMARYIYHNAEQFENKRIADLGSGTGIGAIAALKFTKASKIILTDYTEEIIELLNDNCKLQPSKIEWECLLIDWTQQLTYSRINNQRLDYIIATDVIYKGSPYTELANMLRLISLKQQNIQILIIIPSQRECRDDFLEQMKINGFEWTVENLEGPEYRLKVITNEKESNKYYPGLKELTFDLYRFNQVISNQ